MPNKSNSCLQNKLNFKGNPAICTEKLKTEALNCGDFCLVQCASTVNNLTLAFVCRIEEINGNILLVNLLNKKVGFNIFYFPNIQNKWSVPIAEVFAKLPMPNNAGSMSRGSGMIFKFDFSTYKLG